MHTPTHLVARDLRSPFCGVGWGPGRNSSLRPAAAVVVAAVVVRVPDSRGLRHHGLQPPAAAAPPGRYAAHVRRCHRDGGSGLQARALGLGRLLHRDVDGVPVCGGRLAGRTDYPGSAVRSEQDREGRRGNLFIPNLFIVSLFIVKLCYFQSVHAQSLHFHMVVHFNLFILNPFSLLYPSSIHSSSLCPFLIHSFLQNICRVDVLNTSHVFDQLFHRRVNLRVSWNCFVSFKLEYLRNSMKCKFESSSRHFGFHL